MSNVFEGYRITSPFGMRMHPVYKRLKFHRGIDLVTSPTNGPIKAFVPGEVIHTKMGTPGSGFNNYGIVVAIKDRDGFLHCYCHLSRAAVKVGDKVSQGQVIGYQGNTGIGTGAHLHYEIRKKSSPSYGYTSTEAGVTEPTKYLEQYYAKYNKSEGKSPSDPEPKRKEVMILVDGKKIKNGILDRTYTYAPLREFADAVNVPYTWDNKNKWAYFGKGIIKNCVAEDGHTFIPIREASQIIGAEIEWTGSTSTVNITTKKK
ncbi:Murein DD-endopeptidase MepM [compost metagenome]